MGAGDGAGLFENVPKDARGGDDDASDVVPGNGEGDGGDNEESDGAVPDHQSEDPDDESVWDDPQDDIFGSEDEDFYGGRIAAARSRRDGVIGKSYDALGVIEFEDEDEIENQDDVSNKILPKSLYMFC